jgi:hypothetical protein
MGYDGVVIIIWAISNVGIWVWDNVMIVPKGEKSWENVDRWGRWQYDSMVKGASRDMK